MPRRFIQKRIRVFRLGDLIGGRILALAVFALGVTEIFSVFSIGFRPVAQIHQRFHMSPCPNAVQMRRLPTLDGVSQVSHGGRHGLDGIGVRLRIARLTRPFGSVGLAVGSNYLVGSFVHPVGQCGELLGGGVLALGLTLLHRFRAVHRLTLGDSLELLSGGSVLELESRDGTAHPIG